MAQGLLPVVCAGVLLLQGPGQTEGNPGEGRFIAQGSGHVGLEPFVDAALLLSIAFSLRGLTRN